MNIGRSKGAGVGQTQKLKLGKRVSSQVSPQEQFAETSRSEQSEKPPTKRVRSMAVGIRQKIF